MLPCCLSTTNMSVVGAGGPVKSNPEKSKTEHGHSQKFAAMVDPSGVPPLGAAGIGLPPEQGGGNGAQPPPPGQQLVHQQPAPFDRNNQSIYCNASSSLCHLLQTQPDYQSWSAPRVLAYRPDASSETVEVQLARAGGTYLERFRGGYWKQTKKNAKLVAWANQAMEQIHL